MHRCPISNKCVYIYKVPELEKERKREKICIMDTRGDAYT